MKRLRLRAKPTIEAALSTLFLVAVFAAALVVYKACFTADAQGDLNLQQLASETRRALSETGGVGARFQTFTMHMKSGSVTIDSISFAKSRATVPSTLSGGFIGDQVAEYNRANRREGWRTLHATRMRRTSVQRSSFIASGGIKDASGARELLVDASALTVPSPFAERAWRTVLAVDSKRFNGVLRAQDILQPFAPEEVPHPDVRGPLWCTGVGRAKGSQTDIYCGDLVGMESGLNAELTLLKTEGADLLLRKGRVRRVWRNGAEIGARESAISIGDVLYSQRTGAMIPSAAITGIVAATTEVNGQRRFLVIEGPLRPLAIALARGKPSDVGSDSIFLTLHGGMSGDLDTATAAFLSKHSDVERVEVVALDAWSGGIRVLSGRSQQGALPYVPGFEPGFVGSLVKPIVATAIFSQQPDLLSLRVEAIDGEMVDLVHGIRVAPFNAGHTTGQIDLAQALQASNNKYFVDLVFSSLLESAATTTPFDRDGNTTLGVLEQSALANGLLAVFDVQPGGDKSGDRDDSIWWTNSGTREVLPAMRSQTWYWPWMSSPSLFVSRRSRGTTADSLRGTTADVLSRFAYGQGYNEWTLLGASQAFGRAVTGRSITARMLTRASLDSSRAFSWRTSEWSNEVRRGLRLVAGPGGTADLLSTAFKKAFGTDRVVVYAKTGTANTDDRDNKADRNTLGLFVTLDSRDGGVPDCGLSIVVAIDYTTRPKGARAHRDFAELVLAPIIAKYWNSLTTCHP